MKRGGVYCLAAAVVVVTLVAHWPAVRNGLTNWDDNLYLDMARQHGVSWAGLKWAWTNTYIYYHPLTWLSHGLDFELWGERLAGHHAQSVVWHALNAGLVVLLTWQLSRWAAPWSDAERLLAAGWVGLVFALHPLQVEAVAWLAGRKTLVSAFFSLVAVAAYIRWAADEQRRGWWWAMAAGYVAALLVKPMAVPLPAVFLALDLFPLRRLEGRGWKQLVGEKWLLFGVAGVVTVLTVIGQTGTGALQLMHIGPVERLFVALRGLFFYLWKLVWPAWLSPFYPLGEGDNLWQAEFLLPAVVISVVTGVALIFWRRFPQVTAAWGSYIVLVLPVSGLFQVGGQAVADRFAYLPVVAVMLLLVGGWIWVRRQVNGLGRVILTLALGGHLLWLTVRTQEQIPVWQDGVTLWSAVLTQYPNSTVEYRLLAQALREQGRLEEAWAAAEKAYERRTVATERELGIVFRDIAVGFVERREFPKCLLAARRGVELNSTDTWARAALGLSLLKLRQPEPAVRELEQVVRERPEFSAARYNLACAYAGVGRFAEAKETLQAAMALDPALASVAARDPALAGLREQQ